MRESAQALEVLDREPCALSIVGKEADAVGRSLRKDIDDWECASAAARPAAGVEAGRSENDTVHLSVEQRLQMQASEPRIVVGGAKEDGQP